MDTNPAGGGYSLRTNILTTTHAPGSIHRSASRRKNQLSSPQSEPMPQPDFGRVGGGNPVATSQYVDFLADTSVGQFDDVIPLSGHSSAGSEKNATPLNPCGFKTPDRRQLSPSDADLAEDHSAGDRDPEARASLSPTLGVGRIPKDRRVLMEECFSQIDSLLDRAAQVTNRSRSNIFSLYANTQTIKRGGRTAWNIYETYYYENPKREQDRAGIPDGDCKTCWTSFKSNPVWREFLATFEEAKNIEESETTLQERTRKFKQYVNQLDSIIENNQRWGFETVLVAVGNAIHSDASLCTAICSAGAEKFFQTRLKVDEREITAVLKNHVCNLISQDFETHIAASLKEELAEIDGKSGKPTASKKSSKKQPPSDLDDAQDADEFTLPPVDDGSDDDYVEEDDDAPDGVFSRPFNVIRESILAAYKALSAPHPDIKLGKSMPWKSLPESLAAAGLSMTGYPQIPFPGEVIEDSSHGKRKKRSESAKQSDNKQGIKQIGTHNARILLQAFKNEKIKLVSADKAAMKMNNAPVIIEGPPSPDFAAPRGRRLFLNGNIDRRGPQRLRENLECSPTPSANAHTRKSSKKDDDSDGDDIPLKSQKAVGKQKKKVQPPVEVAKKTPVDTSSANAPGPSKPHPRPIKKTKEGSASDSSAISSVSSLTTSTSTSAVPLPPTIILTSTPARNESTPAPPPSGFNPESESPRSHRVKVGPPPWLAVPAPSRRSATPAQSGRHASPAPSGRHATPRHMSPAPSGCHATPASDGQRPQLREAGGQLAGMSQPTGTTNPSTPAPHLPHLNDPMWGWTKEALPAAPVEARPPPPSTPLPHLEDPTWDWSREALPAAPSAFGAPCLPPANPPKRPSDASEVEKSPSKKVKTSSANTVVPQRSHSANGEQAPHTVRDTTPTITVKQEVDQGWRSHPPPPTNYQAAPAIYQVPPGTYQAPYQPPPSNYASIPHPSHQAPAHSQWTQGWAQQGQGGYQVQTQGYAPHVQSYPPQGYQGFVGAPQAQGYAYPTHPPSGPPGAPLSQPYGQAAHPAYPQGNAPAQQYVQAPPPPADGSAHPLYPQLHPTQLRDPIHAGLPHQPDEQAHRNPYPPYQLTQPLTQIHGPGVNHPHAEPPQPPVEGSNPNNGSTTAHPPCPPSHLAPHPPTERATPNNGSTIAQPSHPSPHLSAEGAIPNNGSMAVHSPYPPTHAPSHTYGAAPPQA